MRVVIDLPAIAHRIRRWCWQRFGPWDRRASRCTECGAGLSADEREYYGDQCNRCVGIDMARWGDT